MSAHHNPLWENYTFTNFTGLTISAMVNRAHATATKNGFHDQTVEFGTQIALIHSEASEALEAHRCGLKPYIAKAVTELHWNGPYDRVLIRAKELQKLHIAEELADILIRVADTAKENGLDLEAAVLAKMNKNDERERMHGKSY